MKAKIIDYIRAGFAGLFLVTFEEVRAEAELRSVATDLKYQLYSWSITQGLVQPATNTVQPINDPVDAVNALADLPEKTLLVLTDFHQFLGDRSQPASPLLTRALKDSIRRARGSAKVIIVMGCALNLPPELEKEFTVIEGQLPDTPVLAVIAEHIAESAKLSHDDNTITQAAEAARGLTTTEAEDIFALSVVREKALSPRLIAREKALAIAKSGLLELDETRVGIQDVGGLEHLKRWLLKRRQAFTREATSYGLPVPKGVLILGIPGTGKSLTAKAAASILERPLLKLDAGKLFAGLVGESEANLRRAIQTAEAIAPAILWIDEIDKGFTGSRSSGSTDGGTSARVLGGFLNWLQEKTSAVFVVATANDVTQLPPELLRKGRFDELFWVDLPSVAERVAIWGIHLGKRQRDPAKFDLELLAKASDKFTGSEIEQAVVDALFDCFDAQVELDTQALAAAVQRTVPLATTMAENISAMREWAKHRARPASGEVEPAGRGKINGRKLAA